MDCDQLWRHLTLLRLRTLKFHDPIGLPGLSRIPGIGLLPASGRRCDVRPDEARAYRLAVEHTIPIERADPVLEVPDRGWIERAMGIPAVDPPDRPLPG